jgi:hypothetical protein
MDTIRTIEKSSISSHESSLSPNDPVDSLDSELSYLRSGSLDSGLSQGSHETSISRDTPHGSARRLQLPQILLESDCNNSSKNPMVVSIEDEAAISNSELSEPRVLSTLISSPHSSSSHYSSSTNASLSGTLTNASPSQTASTTSLSQENSHIDCTSAPNSLSFQTTCGLNGSSSHLSPEDPNPSAHFRVGSQRVASSIQPESSSITSLFKRFSLQWRKKGSIPPSNSSDRVCPSSQSPTCNTPPSTPSNRRDSTSLPHAHTAETASTTGLFLESRPNWLPPKETAELERHQQEFSEMIAAAKRKCTQLSLTLLPFLLLEFIFCYNE